MFETGGSISDRRIIDIDGALRVNVSQERYRHVIRVVRTAKCHAHRLGLSVEKAGLAALGHDLAREWPGRQLLAYVKVHEGYISSDERDKPVLLHGRAGAILLRRQFGIMDQAILEAVEHHTLGKVGMGDLARLIFAADYLEPGRKYTDLAFRRTTKTLCLNCLVRVVIEHSVLRHKDLHPFTAALFEEATYSCSCDSGPKHKDQYFRTVIEQSSDANRQPSGRQT